MIQRLLLVMVAVLLVSAIDMGVSFSADSTDWANEGITEEMTLAQDDTDSDDSEDSDDIYIPEPDDESDDSSDE